MPPPVKVIAKCPKCRANNPAVSAEQWGENADSIMVIFVVSCCKSMIGAQLLAKVPVAPKQDDPLPV
jgi:hypothetical protein